MNHVHHETLHEWFKNHVSKQIVSYANILGTYINHIIP
uniref:Uncharacterized protein n=1 Tax=Arundo donax TaxID=35708 RepID=A0A0A8YHH3_ARUDO